MLSLFYAGFLSVDMRCKTFDKRANSYSRTEGVAAATMLGSDDQCRVAAATHAWLEATAVRQDGKSASLTAPNGLSQSHLCVNALQTAGHAPEDVATSEFHGTGTALGDPTEAGSVASAYAASQAAALSLVAGALKANFGHTEPSSGMLGVFGTLFRIHAKASPPNTQLRRLNPLVSERLWTARPVLMPLQAIPLRCSQLEGVSAFGFSGTIGHAICSAPRPMNVVNVTRCYRFRRIGFPWRERSARLALHHCVLGRHSAQQDTARCTTTHEWQAALDGRDREFHSDHIIGSTPLFAGTSFIEFVRGAFYETSSSIGAFQVTETTFDTFLFLDDDLSKIGMRTRIDETYVSIASQVDGDGVWTTHARLAAGAMSKAELFAKSDLIS